MKFLKFSALALVFLSACLSDSVSGRLKELAAIKIPNAEIEYYDVYGNNAYDIRTQMEMSGPAGLYGGVVVAKTDWRIEWDWPGRGGSDCRLDEADVTYDIRVTLPRWNPWGDPPPDLVDKWTAFIRGIVAHEQGHVNIVVSYIPAIRDAIRGSTCGTAETEAGKVVEELRHQQRQYEVGTGHGESQGIDFP